MHTFAREIILCPCVCFSSRATALSWRRPRGIKSSAKALARFEAVLDDSEAVLHDLKRVQLEYDDLRWNNPKDENKSEGSP